MESTVPHGATRLRGTSLGNLSAANKRIRTHAEIQTAWLPKTPMSPIGSMVTPALEPTPQDSPTTAPNTSSPRKIISSQGGSKEEELQRALQLQRKFTRQRKLKTFVAKMLLGTIVSVCLSWTCWLTLVTIKPNETVNWVMRSQQFDDGTFWLMIDPSDAMVSTSVCGLSMVTAVYGFILVKLPYRRKRVKPVGRRRSSISTRLETMKESLRRDIARGDGDRPRNKLIAILVKFIAPFVQDDSLALKIVRVWIKFIDLVVETVLLKQILEAGAPTPLVVTFTAIMVLNALCCASMMFAPGSFTGLTEVLSDAIFDFLVAVGYPVLTVVYCLATFKLDRAILNINLEIFPIGWFERNASVTANPKYTDIIYKTLKSLQIFTVMDFFTRVGVNLVFAYRLYYVEELVQDPVRSPARQYPKRHHLSAGLLALYAVGLIIFVEESVRTSTLACELHPECVIKAHRWINVEKDSLTQCPCLTLIDQDLAPKSFEEWMNAKNVTEKVIQLAATGDLRTIQLVNRNLPVLPEELRRCHHVKHLSLVYTQMEVLPTWTKEFTELEYLYIEGSFDHSLVSLPEGLFDDMSSLAFIHLGMHMYLQHLPSFKGLVSLKAMTIAIFVSLMELPAFDHLFNLERLMLISLTTIDSLPDLRSLDKLKSFVVNNRGTWCCNGFLGECNLSDPFCDAFWWIPPLASCLPPTEKATDATLAVVNKFSATVCRADRSKILSPAPPTPENAAQCDGILYRRCNISGYQEAMCYNARFMVIYCDPGPLAIEMRRRQIQQGVGDPCNPDYEAWLGCK